MQRVHSCYCHLNLERRDLRAATQRSACLQSNSACCQNRAPPEFRGAKPHGNSAKIILFFQISIPRQEIASGRCRFSGNRAGTDTAIPAAAVGEPQTIPRRTCSSGNLTISARPSRGTRMITVRSAATGYYPIGYSRRKSPRRLPEGVRQRGTPHRQAAAGEALGNPARRRFPAGRAMPRHCFPAGELPENGGYFPAGEARNARRGYTPASNVPNTRRICSPLSGLATYSLAPAARAFCRSRS